MENGNGTAPVHDPASAPGEPGRRALVVGAGIGGLTVAAGLADRGWHVTVLERSASLEPVGAAISLAPNGQRALDRVGVGDAVRALAAWQGSGACAPPTAAGWPAPPARRRGAVRRQPRPAPPRHPDRPAPRPAPRGRGADRIGRRGGRPRRRRRSPPPGPRAHRHGRTRRRPGRRRRRHRLRHPPPALPRTPGPRLRRVHHLAAHGPRPRRTVPAARDLGARHPLGQPTAPRRHRLRVRGRRRPRRRARGGRRARRTAAPLRRLAPPGARPARGRRPARHPPARRPAHAPAAARPPPRPGRPSRGRRPRHGAQPRTGRQPGDRGRRCPRPPSGPRHPARPRPRRLQRRPAAPYQRRRRPGREGRGAHHSAVPLAVRARDALVATASRLGPDLVLRSFAGITDWRPPQRAYAASARGVRPEGDRGRDAGSGT